MKSLHKILALTFMVGILFTSCSKDDETIIEEKEETIEAFLEFVVDGRSIASDAVAYYCNANNKEFLTVSNKENLLGIPLDAFAMEEGDYSITMVEDDNLGSYTIGSAFFPPSVTGGFDLVSSFVGIEVIVDSIDDDLATGSMAGDFLIVDIDGNVEFVPFSVTFAADIIGTSEYCD